MERILLKKAGIETSRLGFGAMRLPRLEDGSLDRERSRRLLQRAYEGGIRYFDTAYNYHGGQSEGLVGQAFSGLRQEIILTTKLPGWECETADDLERIFTSQLERLQTDYVDFYLVHSLYDELWQKLEKLDLLKFLDRIRQDGRARRVGFSFHDERDVFKRILGAYDWDVCQIQYNLLDVEMQAGTRGLRAAVERGVDVLIMEPLRGGALAAKIPDDIRGLWQASERPWSPVEWAFRFLTDEAGVSVILSGMSNEEQLDDNLRIFASRHQPLTADDRKTIRAVQAAYRAKIQVGCTGCEYCLPCPVGVDIPKVFRLLNESFLFDEPDSGREAYRVLIENGRDASLCTACGYCESMCPQQLQVIRELCAADRFLRG